jgi:hypothetical protein
MEKAEENWIYTIVNLTKVKIDRLVSNRKLSRGEALQEFIRKENFYGCFEPGEYLVILPEIQEHNEIFLVNKTEPQIIIQTLKE